MTAEKTSSPVINTHHSNAEHSFFRKAEEPGFFGMQQASSFFNPSIQTKLTVSQPGDAQETEADQVADHVMRMSDEAPVGVSGDQDQNQLQRKEGENEEETPVQARLMRKCAECEKEDKVQKKIMRKAAPMAASTACINPASAAVKDQSSIQTRAHGPPSFTQIHREGRAPPAPAVSFESTLQSTKGSGAALPDATRQKMESSIGADFSGVRIHTGPHAESLSRDIQAQAFTHGSDIYFNNGKYAPYSSEGQHLLAHELTHTIQQGASPGVSPKVQRRSNGRTDRRAQQFIQRKAPLPGPAPLSHSAGLTNAENARPLSAKELRKKRFHDEQHATAERPPVANTAKPADAIVQKKQEPKKEDQKFDEEPGKEEFKVQTKQLDPEPELAGGQKDAFQEMPTPVSPRLQRQSTDTDNNVEPHPGTESLDNEDAPHPESRGPPVHVQALTELNIQRSWLGDAWDAVGDAVSGAVEWAEDQLNEAKEWILGQIRDFVSNIPGYRLLALILEEDPITGAHVPRTGENMLEAGLDILPLGSLFREVLIRTETYAEAAQFVESRVDDFVTLASGISSSLSSFIDGLSVTDIGDPQGVFDRVAGLLQDVITSIVGFITRSAEEFIAMIKRVMIRLVVNFVRARIPRLWPLLTVALGHDPITDEVVPRNGANILNALFEVTDEGREQRRQLQETGTFQKVAAWIDRGIFVFTNLYLAIRTGFSFIWSLVTIESLANPLETFERIYDHFVAPVLNVWAFVADTALVIIGFIKEALLSRLSAWARTQRGYFLITLLIRQDPFTRQAVPFTVENVIHAFMSLMDGGEEQFQQMKQSGAIDRAVNRITAAVRRLNFTVEYIVGLFTGLWNSLRLSDLANPFALFRRVIGTFAQPVLRLVNFVVEIVKIVVEIILQIMQFPTDLIANIINRAMAAWDSIKRNPIGFLMNLLRAIKQGFIQFFDNILDHLLYGLTGWLLSELRDAGVPTLTDFSLRGVISWVLEVLGISMEAIWAKLAAHPRIGPERVARIRGMIDRLEGIWTFIKDVQERGVAAIWDKIQEQLSNLWQVVLDAVKNWVMTKIIQQVTLYLLSLLDPTGIMAVINSAIAIYRAVQSFIRYLRQMLEVINSFVEGIAEIASGNITLAANFLEGTMRRSMPIVIGFLADQVGLGGVGQRIGEMIMRVREMVDQALTWLVNKAVDTGFALFERLIGTGGTTTTGTTPAAAGTPAPEATDQQPARNFPDANEAVPFYMGERSHELRLTSRGGVVEITMSSDERIIFPLYLSKAIEQVNAMEPFPGRTTIRKQLESALRQVDDDAVDRMMEDWNTSKLGGSRARSQPEFIKDRLNQVIPSLQNLVVGDKKVPAIVGLFDLLNRNTKMPGPYAGMRDPLNVVPFGEYTSTQRRAILDANIARNGGSIMSDCEPAETLHDGDPNDPLKANVDHIYPRAKGGSNSYSNAQVISRVSNLRKSDTMEGCP